MRHMLFAFIALVAATPLVPVPASAQATSPGRTACAALPAGDFSRTPDAPTQIVSTAWIAATASYPAHCQVLGYVSPQVGIELRLPDAWNGKFSYIGCGGFCGSASGLGGCAAMLARGYACITSDMGHRSTALDAKWAYDNLQAEVDFGIRATHVATVSGKAITTAYYGRAPVLAYYLGCSTGGRQGMSEAQNFPADFDGIVAGAPVLNELGDGMALLWNVLSTLDRTGRQLFSFDDMRTLHAAVIAACDGNDGVADGLIGDPRRCGFDPRRVICGAAGAKTGACLTAEQAAAVARIYRGPVNGRSDPLYGAAALPGSELNWLNTYVGEAGRPSVYYKFIGDLFRYMAFVPDAGPAWKPEDFDWDRDPARLGTMSAIFNAENPDLRRYRQAGGKLIVYQGWADQSVLPGSIVDYYETASNVVGGAAKANSFFRLFMIPGMAHCSGGEGAYRVDYLAALEAWVERNTAPAMLLGQRPKDAAAGAAPFGSRLLAPDQVAFTRPHFAYPAEARYRRGDPNSAASFVKAVGPAAATTAK